MSATAKMLRILEVDESANVRVSLSTGKWYVSSDLHVAEGGILSGIVHHCATVDEAVEAFWDEASKAPELECRGRRLFWAGFGWRELRAASAGGAP